MSRSVKMDYDKLRALQQEGTVRIDLIAKYGAITVISDEHLFTLMSYTDTRYARKANKIINLPTAEAWAKYYAAVAGLRALNEYEFTEWGGPDYGTEVPEPYPTHTYEYLETYSEWLARCQALRQETA